MGYSSSRGLNAYAPAIGRARGVDTVAEEKTQMLEPDMEIILAAQAAAAQMWVRIAAYIEREALNAPHGADRQAALDLARGIRHRLRPRRVRRPTR